MGTNLRSLAEARRLPPGWAQKDANRAYKQAVAGGALPTDALQLDWVRLTARKQRTGALVIGVGSAALLAVGLAGIAISGLTGPLLLPIANAAIQAVLWTFLGTRASVLLRRTLEAEAVAGTDALARVRRTPLRAPSRSAS